MQIELVSKEKNSITIRFLDADTTLINPLLHELAEDESVAEIDYRSGHPELDSPTLYVKVEKGKPQTALKRAAKNLSNRFKEAREKLEKELK